MRRILVGASVASLLLGPRAISQNGARDDSHKPPTLKQLWTLDATYSDPLHGVSFHYPSAWVRDDSFGYVSPVLQNPIAGFGYETGGFPRGDVPAPYSETNLEGFGIVYAAVPASSAVSCRKSAGSIAHSRAKPILLGGRRFLVYETDDGQFMSQSTSGTLYATYANATCYLFETTVSAASLAVLDDITELTDAQSRFIDAHLLTVVKTIRIRSRKMQ